jgi:D-glycero-D-manno-heptose 1,7-bisphosphate phosphatase
MTNLKAQNSLSKAVFLDRDGVINVDHGYVSQLSDFKFIEGSISAMQKLNRAGYKIIIVTNQSGIARGLYSEKEFLDLMEEVEKILIQNAVKISGIYYCPHHPDGSVPKWSIVCKCRKPSSGMLKKAIRDHQIDPSQSFMVGDKITDIEACQAAGLTRCCLVDHQDEIIDSSMKAIVEIFRDLRHCVDQILLGSVDKGDFQTM